MEFTYIYINVSIYLYILYLKTKARMLQHNKFVQQLEMSALFCGQHLVHVNKFVLCVGKIIKVAIIS